MKVILTSKAVYPFHSYGGLGNYYYYLGKYLAQLGIDVEFVTSGSGVLKTIQFKGLKYTFLPFSRFNQRLEPLCYVFFQGSAMRYLTSAKFDILHGTGGIFPYVLLKKRRPVILQCVGLEPYHVLNPLGRIYGLILNHPSSKLAYLYADAVAVEGKAEAEEVVSRFKISRAKIFVLPNAVDIDLIKRYTLNISITRENLGIHDADLVLINVNRLSLNKGVPYLIDAFKILSRKLDVKLILVGTGPQERKIIDLVKKLNLKDKVLHFKHISDIRKFELYAIADIAVTPTIYEGLPTVILEAMAMGKPIIASNVTEIPQVVKHGKNGFLVPPANSKAIADAVIKIYEGNMISKMGKASMQIVKDYDWKVIAKMAIKKYEELIANQNLQRMTKF